MRSVVAEIEQWKGVSVNDAYLVSSLGAIKSLKSGRILSPAPRPNGYISVSLSDEDGRKTRFYVHRLVAEAFCGGIADGQQVNHLNFKRSDNRSSNLEVVSHRQNIDHSLIAGHYTGQGKNSPVGASSCAAKLNEHKVAVIRQRYALGDSKSQLAREFGVVKQQISNIVKRVSWKHVA